MERLELACSVIAILILQCLTSNAQEVFHCDCLYSQPEKSKYKCIILQNGEAYKEIQKNAVNRYSLLSKPVTITSKCPNAGCRGVDGDRHAIDMCGTVTGKFVSLYYMEWSGGYDTHVLTVRPSAAIAAKVELTGADQGNYR
jgi:hypothetical protein